MRPSDVQIAFVKFAAAAALVATTAFQHHGHIRSFLAAVYDTASRRRPKAPSGPSWRMQPSMLQAYFGDPAVHYEVSVHRKTRTLEIGLHFEGERDANHRWAQALARRAPEIQAQLGPGIEIEEWTRRWVRLHETWPLSGDEWRPSRVLTLELAEAAARRLARFMEVLEPVLAEERSGVAGRAAPR